MRTKALLGLAVIAASALTAAAQNVYSLNVVGYYNIPIPANQFVMIANQLSTTNNTINTLLPNQANGAQLFKFTGAGYQTFTYDDVDLAWLGDGAAAATLNPGEGAFFISPAATTLTFVGEVMQGSLTNTLPIGAYAIRSSMVPQAGDPTLLAIPGEFGDQIYQMKNGSWATYSFDDVDNAWLPQAPNLGVGEAFFYNKAAASTKSQWVRSFTVQ